MENMLQSGWQLRILWTLFVYPKGMILVASAPLLAEIPLPALDMQIPRHIFTNHVACLVTKGAGEQRRQIPQRILVVCQAQFVEVNCGLRQQKSELID